MKRIEMNVASCVECPWESNDDWNTRCRNPAASGIITEAEGPGGGLFPFFDAIHHSKWGTTIHPDCPLPDAPTE
jgi:hypothetical protein